MRYLVIEKFVHGPRAVYDRFAAQGRQLPPGLHYVESWITDDLSRCFQLMETDDPALLDVWIERWSDLAEFEVVGVLRSDEARQRVLGNAPA
jgi:hypothetical protein